MKKFFEIFTQVVKKEDTLILAVSGGVDSMVLLDLISKHHPREKIIVAHFDHSLRGEESDGDREFVLDYCKREKIVAEFEKLDITKLAEDEKMSIENAARKYRYEFHFRVAKKYSATYILTAHHSDDRIETSLFNLIRGTKIGGIHALSSMTNYKGRTAIFRPLFPISKSEILTYAKEHNIVFREDSTNIDTDYQRNYLRHEILPKFEKINPEYRRALSNFIEYTEELKSWIDTEIENFLLGKNEFRVDEFKNKSPFFQKEIIRHIYEKANNGTTGLTEGNIEEILRYILTAEGGTQKQIHDLLLTKKQGIITIFYSL